MNQNLGLPKIASVKKNCAINTLFTYNIVVLHKIMTSVTFGFIPVHDLAEFRFLELQCILVYMSGIPTSVDKYIQHQY